MNHSMTDLKCIRSTYPSQCEASTRVTRVSTMNTALWVFTGVYGCFCVYVCYGFSIGFYRCSRVPGVSVGLYLCFWVYIRVFKKKKKILENLLIV